MAASQNSPDCAPANLPSDRDYRPGPALYIVATPIGNLEDVTFRAVRVLKEVDLIACEDTRQTQKLLNHYGISSPKISYHQHNEATRAAELIDKIQAGASVALVTDAGMPGISDPGFRLISLAIRQNLRVVPIPGASAFLSALVASGLPTDAFSFHGFLPSRRGERQKVLENFKNSRSTEIVYEAPHRIVESLMEICEILGPARQVVIARELTKLHEEFLRGSAAAILEELNSRTGIKGEITLLVRGAEEDAQATTGSPATLSITDRVRQIESEKKVDQSLAIKIAAKERRISKSEAYRQFQRNR